MKFEYLCKTESDTQLLAGALGKALVEFGLGASCLYLRGDLGAGKTTFSRYLLQSIGHVGSVKSPTYTLVEPYELETATVFHFDLYRLSDPEELEFMGVRDYFNNDSACLVEWPDRGANLLPNSDIDINIQHRSNSRLFSIIANSEFGQSCLSSMQIQLGQQ